ncbi:hypothetical protein J3459_008189 [Metarhizium acridum]|nr:hypothetical protein J3459_008189 [Metarhizium acridum]
MWLPETNRLSTLDIYIPESSKYYMRRQHETSRVIQYMKRKTQHQPNYRMFRSLRTVQGLDYVHCLRGVNRITFWDHTQWIANGLKRKVRDKTFQLDVEKTVRGPRAPKDQRNSTLRNLAPLIPGLNPSAETWLIMAAALPELRDELVESDDDGEDEDDNNVGGSDTSSEDSEDEDEDEHEDSYVGDGSESGDSVEIILGSPGAVNHHQTTSVPGSPVILNYGAQRHSIPSPFEDNPGLYNNANSENGVTVEEDTMEHSLPNMIDLTLEDDEELDGHEDMQNETQNSSQTIRDDTMKAEPTSEDTGANTTLSPVPANANLNPSIQEESLFVDDNNGISNSTGEAADNNRTSLSPENDAMRAINAHVEDSQEHRSVARSNSGSEGNMFLSPTPYGQIVHQSTSTGARTVRSGISSLSLGGGDSNGSRSPSSESCASRTSKRSHDDNDKGSDRESGSRKRPRSEGPACVGLGSSMENCIEL